MRAQIVSFHCVLKSSTGQYISTTFNRDVITASGEDNPQLPGLSEGLQDLRKGERRCIFVPAARAYGFYRAELCVDVALDNLSGAATLGIGSKVLWDFSDGECRKSRITHIHGDTITLDANHPLAGQDLIFEIEALEARDATSEEIADSKPSSDGRVLN